MSSGPGSSGKPWPRLMASLSRAACDIASKIVTGRSAKTLFREELLEAIAGSTTDLARKTGGLPAEHAAGKVLVVRQTGRLCRERGRHRALAGPAGEHDLFALWIGNRLRVEGRERHHDAI